jgi:hypothetical protein
VFRIIGIESETYALHPRRGQVIAGRKKGKSARR